MANASEWIQILILGGLAGALGQVARTVVGIKKVNDLAAAESVDPKNLIVASRLFISLTIGFIAGALAALGMGMTIDAIETAQIFGLAAAGYAGADFVEGIISKVTPAEVAAQVATAKAAEVAAKPSPPLAATPQSDGSVG